MIFIGPVAEELYKTIHVYCGRMGCEVIELNSQGDHVHLLVPMSPKESLSKLLGTVKGKAAMQVFRQFPHLKQKPIGVTTFGQEGAVSMRLGLMRKST